MNKEYRAPGFVELVFTLSAGALETFSRGGKKEEKEKKKINLNVARFSIDLLDLLKEKTKGNLSEEESKFLKEMLHQLRMKYVEIKREEGG